MTTQLDLLRERDESPTTALAEVARVLDCTSVLVALGFGGPMVVRDLWRRLGVRAPEQAARVAECLRALEAERRVRWCDETTTWEVTR